MAEVIRPREGCRVFFDAKLKGFIISSFFAWIITVGSVYAVIDSKLSTLQTSVAKLETTLSMMKDNKQLGMLFNRDCGMDAYNDYCNFTIDNYTTIQR